GREGRAVGFVGTPAPVVPVPDDGGAVELLGVVAAVELGGDENGGRGEAEARGGPEAQLRLTGRDAVARGRVGGEGEDEKGENGAVRHERLLALQVHRLG